MSGETAAGGELKRPRGGSAPTIYDIARLAGVNPSTVSRALSQPGRINVKTEAAHPVRRPKELNYRVNPIARALPTGRTSTLGLLVADITNPVIFGIVRGAERAAAERGYTLDHRRVAGVGRARGEAVERVLPSVDGLVLVTTRLRLTRRSCGLARAQADVVHQPRRRGRHSHRARRRARRRAGARTTSRRSGTARWPTSPAPRPRGSARVAGERSAREAARARHVHRRDRPRRADARGRNRRDLRVRGVRVPPPSVAFNDLMAIGLLHAAAEQGHRRAGAAQHRRLRRHLRQRLHDPRHHDGTHAAREAGERAVRHLLVGSWLPAPRRPRRRTTEPPADRARRPRVHRDADRLSAPSLISFAGPCGNRLTNLPQPATIEACQRRCNSTPIACSPSIPPPATIARGLYERVAEAAYSLAARARRTQPAAATTRPSPTRPTCLITARPLRHPLLHAAGVDLADVGVGRSATADPRGGVARARRATGTSSPARRRATGSRTSSRRSSSVTEEPSAAASDAAYDAIGTCLADPRVPSARAVRTLRHRSARDHGRPDRRSLHARRARRRHGLRAAACCRPSAPTRTSIPRTRNSARGSSG